jgi:hypothetical protein
LGAEVVGRLAVGREADTVGLDADGSLLVREGKSDAVLFASDTGSDDAVAFSELEVVSVLVWVAASTAGVGIGVSTCVGAGEGVVAVAAAV